MRRLRDGFPATGCTIFSPQKNAQKKEVDFEVKCQIALENALEMGYNNFVGFAILHIKQLREDRLCPVEFFKV